MESGSQGTLSVKLGVHKKDCMCAFCRAFLLSVNKNDTANATLFARSFLIASQMANGANGKSTA